MRMREQSQRCGTIPYGWESVAALRLSKTKRRAEDLIPNVFEQGVLKLILAMHGPEGNHRSDNAVARILNSKGIKAKKGGKWYGATVQSVREHARPVNPATTPLSETNVD